GRLVAVAARRGQTDRQPRRSRAGARVERMTVVSDRDNVAAAADSADVVLEIEGVSQRFGGLQALDDVSLRILNGQIYGLIGTNGAGKTTLFNVNTGLHHAEQGNFRLKGKPYSPLAPDKVAHAGIARTFQNIRLFGEMTALENVMVGRHVRTRSGVWRAVLKTPFERREEAAIRDRARELLAYVGIERFADYQANTLSYGDQR